MAPWTLFTMMHFSSGSGSGAGSLEVGAQCAVRPSLDCRGRGVDGMISAVLAAIINQ